MHRHFVSSVLVSVGVLFLPSACSSDGGSSSSDPTGEGGGTSPGGATSPGGGMSLGGASGAPASSGGAPSVPAGQLTCSGKPCHAGGQCASDGSCPSFLGDCFSSVDHLDTCEGFCAARGFVCAEKSCNIDGAGTPKPGSGFSLVSYKAADRAACKASATPFQETLDSCTSPIWLSPMKPADDVVRCCCRG